MREILFKAKRIGDGKWIEGDLIKRAHYDEANLILCLLRRGRVRLGLSDVNWTVERDLEELGCHISYSRHGYGAIAYSRIA